MRTSGNAPGLWFTEYAFFLERFYWNVQAFYFISVINTSFSDSAGRLKSLTWLCQKQGIWCRLLAWLSSPCNNQQSHHLLVVIYGFGFTCERSRADGQPCWAACPLASAGCPLERAPEPLPWCSRCGSALTAVAHNRYKRRHLIQKSCENWEEDSRTKVVFIYLTFEQEIPYSRVGYG